MQVAEGAEALAKLSRPPIFIVGVHRSGTTWVYDMLTAHPEVAGVFESALFSLRLGVAPLFHPAHWYARPDELEPDREFFGRSFRLNQMLDREEALRDVRRLTATWLARRIEPRHRFLVEKTPEHHRTMRLISDLFPGATFIHVVRDGRDVAVSLQAAARSWPISRHKAHTARSVAADWSGTLRSAREQARAGQLRYLEVRYESLHSQCERELRRIFNFCGIPADAHLVTRLVAASAFESHAQRGENAFRRHGRVGEWGERFGVRDRWAFQRVAGDALIEFGYERNRYWWMPWGMRRQRSIPGDRAP